MKPSKELVEMAQKFCQGKFATANLDLLGNGGTVEVSPSLAEFGALIARDCAEIARENTLDFAGEQIAEAILAKYTGKEK
jgi:hypothetical protein